MFDQFYEDILESENARSAQRGWLRLHAIARLVRNLHVGHFHTDANGRLNMPLLLQFLLLQNGFHPVSFVGMQEIFSGNVSLNDVVEQLRQAQPEPVVPSPDGDDSYPDDSYQAILIRGRTPILRMTSRRIRVTTGTRSITVPIRCSRIIRRGDRWRASPRASRARWVVCTTRVRRRRMPTPRRCRPVSGTRLMRKRG